MARGTSIHIGVNEPARGPGQPLSRSEGSAWKMAELAYQAGYGSIHLLRGADATRSAVRDLLSAEAEALKPGDTLFVSFSGHGLQVPDAGADERDHADETWCLQDTHLVDDELVEIWKRAAAGTRVLVVSESCYGGGMTRGYDYVLDTPPNLYWPVYRSDEPVMRGVKQFAQPQSSCISSTPRPDDGIDASVLMMTASAEAQPAQEGLYIHHLLDLWNGGAFRGSFCALHSRLCERVQQDNPNQHPQIVMLGKPDPTFPLEAAFHLVAPARNQGAPDHPVMRDGGPRRGVMRGGDEY